MFCLNCKKKLTSIQLQRKNTCCSKSCANKIKRRRYKYDTHFLDNKDEFYAYFIGYFVADGYISSKKQLSIISKDLQIINDFRRKTKHVGKIPEHKPKRGNTRYRILFHGPPVDTILNLGYPAGPKTGEEFIPKTITKNIFPHFLRGVFDGDGSVGTYRNYLTSQITCASKKFLEDILQRLQEEKIVNGGSLLQCPNSLAFNLTFGHTDSVNLYKYMYKTYSITLLRKLEVFKKGCATKVTVVKRNHSDVCCLPNCGNSYLARGYCKKHYRQLPDQREKIKEQKRRYYLKSKLKHNKEAA